MIQDCVEPALDDRMSGQVVASVNVDARLAAIALETDWHETQLVHLERERSTLLGEKLAPVEDEFRDTKSALLVELRERGTPVGALELSLVVGVSKQAVHKHLTDLAEAGKVTHVDGLWIAASA